jgi:membrane protein required for beta-lactamase induction
MIDAVFARPVFWIGLLIGTAETLVCLHFFVRRSPTYTGSHPKLRAALLQLISLQGLLLLVNGFREMPPLIVIGLVLGMLVGMWLYGAWDLLRGAERQRDAARRDAQHVTSLDTLSHKTGDVRDDG